MGVGASPVRVTGIERPDERAQRPRSIVAVVVVVVVVVEVFVEGFDGELVDADPATRGFGSKPARERFGDLDDHRHAGQCASERAGLSRDCRLFGLERGCWLACLMST